MGCACKSSSGVKKQVSQITKRNPSTNSSSHVVTRSTPKPERKQIIIRRPSR